MIEHIMMKLRSAKQPTRLKVLTMESCICRYLVDLPGTDIVSQKFLMSCIELFPNHSYMLIIDLQMSTYIVDFSILTHLWQNDIIRYVLYGYYKDAENNESFRIFHINQFLTHSKCEVEICLDKLSKKKKKNTEEKRKKHMKIKVKTEQE